MFKFNMPKIAHFGTFDVDNYGDLLFPHIVELRLPKYKWVHVSPTNKATVFKDSKEIIAFNAVKKKEYEAVVIGGGNILHLLDNHSTVYKKETGFAYANLWVGAAKMASSQNIPCVFNAPGISREFTNFIQKKIAYSTFKAANYVALRERFSKEIAFGTFKNGTNSGNMFSVVPDTAFDIDKLWPIKIVDIQDYITVNLNERYHVNIEDTASNLDKISVKLKMPIKLIVIGDCHGDKMFTSKVSKKMSSTHTIIASDGLKKIAHIIGHGKYFLGSSMHAFITALSYGVPALLVLNSNPLHKFLGLLEITKLDCSVICKSFEAALKNISAPAILTKDVKLKIQSDLDIHWCKIDDIVKNKVPSSSSFFINKFEVLLNLNLKFYKILNKFQ